MLKTLKVKVLATLWLFILGLGLPGCGQSGATVPAISQPQVDTNSVLPTTTPVVPTTIPPATSPLVVPSPTVVKTNAATANPKPNPQNNPVKEGDYITIRFSELYTALPSTGNLQFSDKLLSAKNKPIKIVGYMAPPLKPDLDFFVLTKIRLVFCPFCSTSTDWPEDIMLVTMPDGKTIKQIDEPITIMGKLEIGEAVDAKTGFVSLLRIRADNVEVFKGS